MLLVRTELKVKYKGSVLGYAWSMLNPALVLAIYYVVFKIIARNHQPNFAIWLFSGLLVWNLFNGSAAGRHRVVVGKAGIVKKVAFPRELLALSVVGVNLVLFAIQVVVLILALLIFGITPDFTFVALLPLALVALLGVHRGAVHLPVGGQRLSPRHPAPDRGAADGLVLGHVHRLHLREIFLSGQPRTTRR